jgi:TonB-dependent SusC/RagA subfamily outer membrane receptor
MENFFLYFVKSSGILSLFWCCYTLFLEKETFFGLNRIFILSGIFLSLLFPFWTLTETVLLEPIPSTLTETTTLEPTPIAPPSFDWWSVIALIYGIGVLFLLGRFGIQLFSLRRMIRQGSMVETNGIKVIESKADTSPFSFFNIIVYNPALHQPDELEKIIAHEKIHSLQWHSLDILLVHLFSVFQWLNPFVWLYKKALSQNLEYIADQGVIKRVSSAKEYQYLLLKNASAHLQYSSIINPFFTSSIKKRIVMLSKNRSSKLKAWKFGLVIPFLAFFLMAFNTKKVTQVITSNQEESTMETQDMDTTKVEFIINKTSTEEDLKNISNTLKQDYNVTQSFTAVKRNKMGAIVNISSSFTVSKSDGTMVKGQNNFEDPNGITSFSIYVETDKRMGIISMGHETTENNNLEGLTKYQQNRKTDNQPKTIKNEVTAVGPISPIYVVDGIELAVSSQATGIDPSDIQSVNVLKGVAATNKYGEKGKNGVVEITTKMYHHSMNPIKTSPSTQNYEYSYIKSDKEPLFIVDGVEKDADFDFGTIAPSAIESMNVIKGPEAVQKFGKKGENGVVEIITKKSEWNVGAASNTTWAINVPSSNENNAFIKDKDGNSTNSKWKVNYGINMNDPDDILDITTYKKQGMEKAVIFVDGVNKGKNYMPTMKYSEVEYISTYPPSKGIINRYGKLAKNGVIEIVTKEN